MKRFFYTLLFCFLVISGSAQLSLTPSDTDACVCSGSCSYVGDGQTTFSYSLFGSDETVLQTGLDVTEMLIENLCPDVYSLTIETPDSTLHFWFNISAAGSQLANAVQLDICSTDPDINLNTLLGNTISGGVWRNPEGAVMNGQLVHPYSMQSGWYTYSVINNQCSEVTGIYFNFHQNAFPGLTTVYLICDNYLPFQMLPHLNGNADENGYWTTPDGEVVDGMFYPAAASATSYTYYYIIDTVQGCEPAIAVFIVDVSHQPAAGIDTSIQICTDAAPFNMLDVIPGNPDTNGQWYNDQWEEVNDVFDPEVNVPGTYRYYINSQVPCMNVNTHLTIEIHEPSDTLIIQEACSEYVWPANNETYSSSGMYSTTYIDQNGCDSTIHLSLTIHQTSGIMEVEHCGPYFWEATNLIYTESGTYDATFANQLGCDSIVHLILNLHNPYESFQNISACDSFLWEENDQTYLESGVYSATYMNAFGCDSTLYLNLNLTSVDASIIQLGDSLVSVSTGQSYQWIDCSNGNVEIAGATEFYYQPIVSGEFALIVTSDNCEGYAECFPFVIDEIQSTNKDSFRIYPNPVENQVYIRLNSDGLKMFQLLDIHGNIVKSGYLNAELAVVPFSELASGIYLLVLEGKSYRIAKY